MANPTSALGALGDVVDQDDGGAGALRQLARDASDPVGHLVVVVGRAAHRAQRLGDAVEYDQRSRLVKQVVPRVDLGDVER